MTVHLGPFRPKGIQDDVRMTLRAVMSLEKRKLGKATISTKGDTMKAHGNDITVSTHGKEGWIHLTTDIDPVSPNKLAMASKYLNSIIAYLTELFSGFMKVSVTVTITERLPTMQLAKLFSPTLLREMSKALGVSVVPNGIWLISRSEGDKRSMIVTRSKDRYEVDYIHFFKTGTQIPKDVLMETYKRLKERIPASLAVFQAG
jgi:hypothetical protein